MASEATNSFVPTHAASDVVGTVDAVAAREHPGRRGAVRRPSPARSGTRARCSASPSASSDRWRRRVARRADRAVDGAALVARRRLAQRAEPVVRVRRRHEATRRARAVHERLAIQSSSAAGSRACTHSANLARPVGSSDHAHDGAVAVVARLEHLALAVRGGEHVTACPRHAERHDAVRRAEPLGDDVDEAVQVLAGRDRDDDRAGVRGRERAACAGARSALLIASTSSTPPAPISPSTLRTASIWANGSGAGRVDDVHEHVGEAHRVERRAERLDELVRQVAHEPDRVGDEDASRRPAAGAGASAGRASRRGGPRRARRRS